MVIPSVPNPTDPNVTDWNCETPSRVIKETTKTREDPPTNQDSHDFADVNENRSKDICTELTSHGEFSLAESVPTVLKRTDESRLIPC